MRGVLDLSLLLGGIGVSDNFLERSSLYGGLPDSCLTFFLSKDHSLGSQ